MQSHANSLARIESDWTLRDGVNSLISNISCTKQSKLFRHMSNRTQFELNYLRDSALSPATIPDSLFESFLNLKMAS